MNALNLRLMTLSGDFFTCSSHEDVTVEKALELVTAHAASGGYRDVRVIADDDGFSLRYTATTPGGRPGRNIAFADADLPVTFPACTVSSKAGAR